MVGVSWITKKYGFANCVLIVYKDYGTYYIYGNDGLIDTMKDRMILTWLVNRFLLQTKIIENVPLGK